MILDWEQADAAVLAVLRDWGPGTLSVARLSRDSGVSPAAARASVAALAIDGLVCLIPDHGETRYVIRHLHAGPGACGDPGMTDVVVEIRPDRR